MRRKIDILDVICFFCKIGTIVFSIDLAGLILIGILHLFDMLTPPIFFSWVGFSIFAIAIGVILLVLLFLNDLINDIKYRKRSTN